MKTNKQKIKLELKELERKGALNQTTVQALNNNLKFEGYDFSIRYFEIGYPYFSIYYEIQNIADSKIPKHKSPNIVQLDKINRFEGSKRVKIPSLQSVKYGGKKIFILASTLVPALLNPLPNNAEPTLLKDNTTIEKINTHENQISLVDKFFGKSIDKKIRYEVKVSLEEVKLNEIIVVQDNGNGSTGLPGARGFQGPPRIKGRRHRNDINIRGLNNLPPGPFSRPPVKVDTDYLNAQGGQGGQCSASKFDMKKEYKSFMDDMSRKNIAVDCDQQRFNDLAVNPETGMVEQKSLFEAKGGLQGEGQKMYKNLRRPDNPDVRLDFEATNIETGEPMFVDHKGMIDFGSLKEQGVDISNFPSHETVAYRMGRSLAQQKNRFLGLPGGPKSTDDVLHLVNFDNIRDLSEKPLLVSATIDGAENAGCEKGIVFINYE